MSDSQDNKTNIAQNQTVFTLTFTEEDLNKILNIIAQLPYANVFSLINNIQAQAQAQAAQSKLLNN